MVTMSDIAQACGVSRSVVSLVLNGREKEVGIAQQTRDRIMAAAEELGYCRNELARAIVTGRNNVVAVIVSGDPDLEFTQRIISGALDAASEQNFSCQTVSAASRGDGDHPAETAGAADCGRSSS